MNPICVPCKRFYRPAKTGFYFVEDMPRPGLDRPATPGDGADWQPYKIWCGDLWECRGCGSQIISGVGRGPVREHFQSDFETTVDQLGADFHVYDCC